MIQYNYLYNQLDSHLDDHKLTLECIERVLRIIKYCRLNCSLVGLSKADESFLTDAHLKATLKKIKLIFKHYFDYWQVKDLCRKVLEMDASNQSAKAYLKRVKMILGY